MVDTASISKTFTDSEVPEFSNISGDTNPLHLDNQFAKDSPIRQRIIHGMLTVSLFSGLLGVTLPKKRTIFLGQNLVFKAYMKKIGIDSANGNLKKSSSTGLP